MEDSTQKIFNFTGALLAAGLLGVYFFLDPEQHFFPKCPFLWLSGWKCPGCGSQRAVHHLLHGDVTEALRVNFLFVLAYPMSCWDLLWNIPLGDGNKWPSDAGGTAIGLLWWRWCVLFFLVSSGTSGGFNLLPRSQNPYQKA